MTRINLQKFRKQLLEHDIKAINDNIELLFVILHSQNNRIKKLENKTPWYKRLWKNEKQHDKQQ